MTGVLCIDKPAGPTSFAVVAEVRRLTGEKAGHAGTLDPMATGVLPVLIGRATRALPLLPSHEKAYEATFRPGLVTDTGDSTGRVVNIQKNEPIVLQGKPTVLQGKPVVSMSKPIVPKSGPYSAPGLPVSRRQVEAAVEACRGRQRQLPPMFSAVKVGGRRLYELARQEKTVRREPRTVTVYDIRLLGGPDGNGDWKIAVRCSAGTYIRTLCEKIGTLLGCGAAMTSLRRTMAAGFSLKDCVPLSEAEELARQGRLGGRVIPLKTVFSGLPAVRVTQKQAARFENGGALSLQRLDVGELGTRPVPEGDERPGNSPAPGASAAPTNVGSAPGAAECGAPAYDAPACDAPAYDAPAYEYEAPALGAETLCRVLGPDGRLLGIARLDREADELRVALNRLGPAGADSAGADPAKAGQ